VAKVAAIPFRLWTATPYAVEIKGGHNFGERQEAQNGNFDSCANSTGHCTSYRHTLAVSLTRNSGLIYGHATMIPSKPLQA
jgi:hypothetical protein